MRRWGWLSLLSLTIVVTLLAGCGGSKQVFSTGALSSVRLTTASFSLLSARYYSAGSPLLTLYLEGDGRAWASRYRLSSDPTPVNPLALRLAAVDVDLNKQQSVAWLGRACQYQPVGGDPACESRYWSSHRFSEKVVASMNEAVDQLMKESGAKQLRLVGFSGGGAVAVLLAARRSDVVGVVTVAGNLDHDWVNRHHGVTLLSGSLNPLVVAGQIRKVPQIHFVGGKDEVVPDEVVTRFIAMGKADLCAHKILVRNVAHIKGWVEQWGRLLQGVDTELSCG